MYCHPYYLRFVLLKGSKMGKGAMRIPSGRVAQSKGVEYDTREHTGERQVRYNWVQRVCSQSANLALQPFEGAEVTCKQLAHEWIRQNI
jgi:hypothetical protein